MLVTFSSDAHENITMFGDIALQLIKFMGHSGTVPGALTVDDVADALVRLQAGLVQHRQAEPSATHEKEDDVRVGLALRAYPLVMMLNSACKKKCAVMWTS